jgi:CheY-like chemotaxis protein
MPKKILIVDDEPDILDVVQFRLSRKGYEVILAVNGREALEKINQQKPDLVFLDYRMPFLNGLEVCKRIKENESSKSTPVIILTASLAVVTDEELSQVHADGRLVKPFEPEELFRIIEKFIP